MFGEDYRNDRQHSRELRAFATAGLGSPRRDCWTGPPMPPKGLPWCRTEVAAAVGVGDEVIRLDQRSPAGKAGASAWRPIFWRLPDGCCRPNRGLATFGRRRIVPETRQPRTRRSAAHSPGSMPRCEWPTPGPCPSRTTPGGSTPPRLPKTAGRPASAQRSTPPRRRGRTARPVGPVGTQAAAGGPIAANAVRPTHGRWLGRCRGPRRRPTSSLRRMDGRIERDRRRLREYYGALLRETDPRKPGGGAHTRSGEDRRPETGRRPGTSPQAGRTRRALRGPCNLGTAGADPHRDPNAGGRSVGASQACRAKAHRILEPAGQTARAALLQPMRCKHVFRGVHRRRRVPLCADCAR